MNCSKSSTPDVPNLCTSEHSKRGLAWPSSRQQVAAAAGARDRLAGFHEYAFNLLVQLVAVGDDGDAAIRQVFQYPFGQHHYNAFAACLECAR